MRQWALFRIVLVTLVLHWAAPGFSLQIHGVFTGGAQPNGFGNGTLVDAFEAAAGLYERALLDDRTITISYQWTSLDPGFLGFGFPTGPDTGMMAFQNGSAFDGEWYFDETPNEDSGFSFLETGATDYGAGLVNDRRLLFGATPETQQFDLFTLMLHEMGHVLGIFKQADHVDGFIDILAPLPFAGSRLPAGTPRHLDIPGAVMDSSIGFAVRRLPTEADILAIAQSGGYSNVDLNPARAPEPALTFLLLAGSISFAMRRGLGGSR